MFGQADKSLEMIVIGIADANARLVNGSGYHVLVCFRPP
jgi:hypothetical protein